MAKRKALSKGLRFDIFKRDGFTCQYCGSRPPDIVLEIDHIIPICEGGTNESMNLVSACEACNWGKGKKLLDKPQRPDAELAWLEAQQELAELKRYMYARREKEAFISEIVEMIQADWKEESGKKWFLPNRIIRSMLLRYPPEIVEEALSNVAYKVRGGYLEPGEGVWKYAWATVRNMATEADDG